MKNNKKGFTIVELIIVMAVIAILAAALIPTFSNMITKAHRSVDVQLIKSVNTKLNMELAEEGLAKYDTMSESVYAVAKGGLAIDKIRATSDYNIAWDSKSGLFVLIIDMYVDPKVCYPTDIEENIVAIDITNNPYSEHKASDYYIVTKSSEFNVEDNKNYKNPYSTYAYNDGGWVGDLAKITVNGSFDAGDVTTFEKISYVNTQDSNPLNVTIRSNTFTTRLYVNAPLDTVNFYGYSGIVNIEAVGNYSFNNYGVIGRVTINQGHLCINKDSKVYCVMEKESYSGALLPTSIESGAFVSTGKENCSGGEKNIYGIAYDTVLDCGLNKHAETALIVDNVSEYEVCLCCGYTLITCVDASEVSLKTSLNVYYGTTLSYDNINKKATYRMNTSASYMLNNNLGSRKIDKSNLRLVEEPIVNPATVETPNPLCIHEFDERQLYAEAYCTQQGTIEASCLHCTAMLYEHTLINKLNHYGDKAEFDIFGNTYYLQTNYCQACRLPVLKFETTSCMESEDGERVSEVTFESNIFDTSYQVIDISIGNFNKTYYSLAEFMDEFGLPKQSIEWMYWYYNTSPDVGLVKVTDQYINYYKDEFTKYGLSNSEMKEFASKVIQIYMTNLGYGFENKNGSKVLNYGVVDLFYRDYMYVIHFDEDITEDMEWALYIECPKDWDNYYSIKLDDCVSYYYDYQMNIAANEEIYVYPNNPDNSYEQRDNNTGMDLYTNIFNLVSRKTNCIGLEALSEEMYGKTIYIDIVLFDVGSSSYGKYVIGSFNYTFTSK